MLKIGITGGIGSGKTTICKIFELLGTPVYYSDEVSKHLLVSDAGIKNKILEMFGDQVLDKQGAISRKKIAEQVFADAGQLRKLNSIMHPAVALHFEEWSKQRDAFPYIIKEAAIMFESGAYKQMDKIVSITAPESLRIARVMKRDNTSEEAIRQRMHAQLSEEERIKKSQYVIVNDEQQLVIPQVIKLHRQWIIDN